MKKIFLALLIILFAFACSSDGTKKRTKKQAPAYRPITAGDVR